MATWWALKDRMEQALSASWGNLKILLRDHHAEAQGLVECPPRLLETPSSLSAMDLAATTANTAISPENAVKSEWDIFLRILMTTSPIPWVHAHHTVFCRFRSKNHPGSTSSGCPTSQSHVLPTTLLHTNTSKYLSHFTSNAFPYSTQVASRTPIRSAVANCDFGHGVWLHIRKTKVHLDKL